MIPLLLEGVPYLPRLSSSSRLSLAGGSYGLCERCGRETKHDFESIHHGSAQFEAISRTSLRAMACAKFSYESAGTMNEPGPPITLSV